MGAHKINDCSMLDQALANRLGLFEHRLTAASKLELGSASVMRGEGIAAIVCGGCKGKWAAQKVAAGWVRGISFEREQVKARSELSCLIYAKTSLQ